ncbi:DUF4846 domain-containing protein [Hymenobacter sp. 15J16-1T3B]|uniref:DUF4846 domain-containing protein n=1 Tax=Hymenobacter sp. 15J16-1T3B TaxID=2886941 RepID=UPI001D116DF5|nr:DUF4846 domain-containing protein [Hymenobacter sp. 15J16-1T3B]MCC3156788.1 DUF4846 domain-containing protein [Hymenobacter sp. 15J16-1T3B]
MVTYNRPAAAQTLQPASTSPRYEWLTKPYNPQAALAARFAPPAGCQRVAVTPGSYGEWLRGLPLRPRGTAVRLHDGRLKDPQTVHAAVIDIDTGLRDLQQCADAAIRLRAEYQFTRNFRSIHFHLTSGHDIWFGDWVDGKGFQVQGEDVVAAPRPAEAPTHAALRRYLDVVFTYAGTKSVSREMRPVPLAQAQPGDVLVLGGSPGHAVTVLDVAEHPGTHVRYALLAQSYMPAQDMHVLRNVEEPQLGAWFRLAAVDGMFATPEWDFEADQLKRWQ